MVDDQTGDESARDQQCRAEPRWCLVGNVVAQRLHGEDSELRRGSKLFPGGTKVYYQSAYWGMGAESVTVLGLSRRPRRWITATMRSSLIENWRAKLVYTPRVLQELQDDDIHGDEGEARTLAEVMNRISASYSTRLAARAPQECHQVAADVRAVILSGPAPSGDDEDQAFILYRGTQAIAGLVYQAAPPTLGAPRAAPFTWRYLWLRPLGQRTGTDTTEPVGDQPDETAAAFLTALHVRFPWHDLTALRAELTAQHT
jgi:acyl-CoA synthetase (AMP-forming)/AMP-acid ligase II